MVKLRIFAAHLPCILLTTLLWLASASPSSAQQSLIPLLSYSPTSSLPRLLYSGTQVSLNGRILPTRWNQWQMDATAEIHTAINDVGVMQLIGVELLNTTDAEKQPVQWFSEPTTTPFVLTSWLRGAYRYLDVTQFATLAGWQFSTARDTLQITTPAARVKTIRQGRQAWGDRIVVDLDRPTPWQVTQRQDGVWDVSIETTPKRTTIPLNLPDGLYPRVSTLPNPNRLVIDVRPDAMVERDIIWSSGLRWRQQFFSLGDSRFPVVWLEIKQDIGLTLKPIASEPTTLVGITPLLKIAQRYWAVAAINGGFFNRNNKSPLGAMRRDGRWLSSPILNRGAIAWNDAGFTKIGRLSLQETIITSTKQRLPILTFNSGYVQAGIARYSLEWGPTYTPLIDNEIIVVVQNNQVTAQLPGGEAGKTAFPILSNGYLLAIRADKATANLLPVGTLVRGESVTQPAYFADYPQILGAGPLLVQNRQIVLDAKAEGFSDAFIRETAVRSAIGTTTEGALIIAAVQNRAGGDGPTLAETAEIMQQMGCIDALNLDGGSSTSLYLGGQLLNRSSRTAARVHNGFGVFLTPHNANLVPHPFFD